MRLTPTLIVMISLFAPLASADVFTWEWDWMVSANETAHQASALIVREDESASQTVDSVLDVQIEGHGFSSLLALKTDHLYTDLAGQHADSELVVQELFWQGTPSFIDAPLDLTIGKMRLDWGVGYGYRPLDLLKPYRRHPVGIQVEEGVGLAMLSYFDLEGEWSLVYSDSSLTSQATTPLEASNEQQGVGVRRYILSGDTEWQAIGYYDDVRQGVIGGSVVSVLNSAWAVHVSSVYQRRFDSYQIQDDNQPVHLATQKGGFQALAGLNWANEVGNNVIVEYWYDNRSWDRSDWERALARTSQLSTDPMTAGLASSYAQGLGHSNLVAHNIMFHWSLDSTSWSQWAWSQERLWLNRITPTFDLLYSPQDGGAIATQWIDVSAYDSGDASVNVELAARFFTGGSGSVYANLGDKRMIFINLKGKF